jgi:hypothetical protein
LSLPQSFSAKTVASRCAAEPPWRFDSGFRNLEKINGLRLGDPRKAKQSVA